jgi:hypothetical protein
MTGIRKLLLALAVVAVLFALLKGFSFFDMQRYLGTARSDLDRNRTELKKLQAAIADRRSEFTMLTAATAGTGIGALLCVLCAARSIKRRAPG